MTLYLTSDLHVDHYAENRTEISSFIERYLPSSDVLCVAGDTADNPKIFVDFYRLASQKYRQIFVTFGNHDLTVRHDDYFLQNPFTETDKKLSWIKEKLSELPNVTLLDGTTAKIGKLTIGGCMGFNDFSVGSRTWPHPKEWLLNQWQHWYDNVHWRYMDNNPGAILKDELRKLRNVISQKPDIVMTHFIPTAFGIPRKYENEYSNAFFYFNADEYLAKMKNKSVWLAGHTHDTGKKILSIGRNKITLLLNPVGYPMETKGRYSLKDRVAAAMIKL
ncbi:MAG: metallophosphoesterase [Treponema sp.]|nr:metallophosphoesterase [Treponema sp.]